MWKTKLCCKSFSALCFCLVLFTFWSWSVVQYSCCHIVIMVIHWLTVMLLMCCWATVQLLLTPAAGYRKPRSAPYAQSADRRHTWLARDPSSPLLYTAHRRFDSVVLWGRDTKKILLLLFTQLQPNSEEKSTHIQRPTAVLSGSIIA